eukprot:gb/GFBE01008787.1/.p1 GENE.gb/GFBE01008787.1/~~gb/GFBE01008787.1/.p1  ORF type:complete len:134 (+),score=23.92 gb/GFBE01008787.1/:1-402(+)
MVVKVEVTGRDEVEGVVWYDIQVTNESGRSWAIQKRYTDFVNLDAELQTSKSLTTARLPGKDNFNPRKLFDHNGFLEGREQDLRTYLNTLASQVQTMAQEPLLDKFFQVDLSVDRSGMVEEPAPASKVELRGR